MVKMGFSNDKKEHQEKGTESCTIKTSASRINNTCFRILQNRISVQEQANLREYRVTRNKDEELQQRYIPRSNERYHNSSYGINENIIMPMCSIKQDFNKLSDKTWRFF